LEQYNVFFILPEIRPLLLPSITFPQPSPRGEGWGKVREMRVEEALFKITGHYLFPIT
jgi:hypothetical protein